MISKQKNIYGSVILLSQGKTVTEGVTLREKVILFAMLHTLKRSKSCKEDQKRSNSGILLLVKIKFKLPFKVICLNPTQGLEPIYKATKEACRKEKGKDRLWPLTNSRILDHWSTSQL